MAIGASAVVKRAEKNKRPFVSGADGGGFCWEHKKKPSQLPARTQACVAHRGLRCSVFGLRSSYTQTSTVLYHTVPYIDGHRHGPRTTLYPM